MTNEPPLYRFLARRSASGFNFFGGSNMPHPGYENDGFWAPATQIPDEFKLALGNFIINRDGNAEWMQDAWTLCKPKPEVEETSNDRNNSEPAEPAEAANHQ